MKWFFINRVFSLGFLRYFVRIECFAETNSETDLTARRLGYDESVCLYVIAVMVCYCENRIAGVEARSLGNNTEKAVARGLGQKFLE